MSGFTTGAAMSIGLSQINNALGFNGKVATKGYPTSYVTFPSSTEHTIFTSLLLHFSHRYFPPKQGKLT